MSVRYKNELNFVSTNEELGYSHDLIQKALNQSMTAINGNCERRVKLLANVLRFVLKDKT